jgi:hypothetical protein
LVGQRQLDDKPVYIVVFVELFDFFEQFGFDVVLGILTSVDSKPTSSQALTLLPT